MSTPTFAITSRFMTMDLPYMAQWFEYYLKMGISKFYLYYIDQEDRFYDLERVPGFLLDERVVVIQKVEQASIENNNDIFWMRPFEIQETFLLHIDSDEFLYVRGLKLSEFVERFPGVDCYYFSWLMCPSPRRYVESMQSILYDRLAPQYLIAEGRKAMGRVEKIRFAQLDTHRFDIKPGYGYERDFVKKIMDFEGGEGEGEGGCCLLHFSYRGIYDCYLKWRHQKMKTHQDDHIRASGGDAFLNREIRTFPLHEIPTRILCYLAEISNRNPKRRFAWNLGVEAVTDLELLQTLFQRDTQRETIFVARIEALLRMNLFKNLLLPPHGIKNYIKNISLYSNPSITFS